MENKLANSKQRLDTIKRLIKLVKTDTAYEGEFLSGERLRISWVSEQILRVQITATEFSANPKPNAVEHTTKMTVATPISNSAVFQASELLDTVENYRIKFGRYTLIYKKNPALMTIYDEQKRRYVLQQVLPVSLTQTTSTEVLAQDANEFYFGGGTQNGRFTHKGERIKIENENNWTTGGVSSPNPFFWSNSGFGEVRHTWQPGLYDFGSNKKDQTGITHNDPNFDNFYLLGDSPAEILHHYYELTGQPILLPKFGFYLAHLNAYNRDIWVKSDADSALEFPDGAKYTEYSPEKLGNQTGIKESLNGENNNYQFSARAVIDQYQKLDFPLGWFLPNDGYGAGYGQTDSLQGDLNNLEAFSNYALKHGVQLGLWTQSSLHPADVSAPQKGERNLNKEISQANLAALKTDVAWVGSGYSFGLNGIADATNTFAKETNGRVRPLILTLDGWAGTQRYGAVWTGDQIGGEWEYIRFHIPTYIGTGLSGQPNIGSDMDGIYGGGDPEVNVRDYQWKTFTPIQLSMDGWGTNPKNPFTFGRKATQINRAYLKLKTQMLPYIYSIAHEALSGKPMIRAMFLEFPHEKINYTKLVQYQYMWGPSFLIAPIYTAEKNSAGDALRHNVYLPDAHQLWIDFFTGQKYMGGVTVDNLVYEHWHAPVFIKAGAIIPFNQASNNPTEIDQTHRIINFYPAGNSEFTLVDDDGTSTSYLDPQTAQTTFSSQLSGPQLTLKIAKTTGGFSGFASEQSTLLNVLCDHHPGEITVKINGQEISLPEADSRLAFEQLAHGFIYTKKFSPSEYFDTFTSEIKPQHALQIKLPPMDITKYAIEVSIKNFRYGTEISSAQIIDSAFHLPRKFAIDLAQTTPTSLHLVWQQDEQIKAYELLVNGQRHVNIKGNNFTVTELDYDSIYCFKIRAKSLNKVSDWSEQIVGKTSIDPLTNSIKNIKASSNVFDQSEREIKFLVDRNTTTEWSTDPETAISDPENEEYTELTFEFEQPYQLDRLEYVPRTVTQLGELEEISLSFSADGQNWSAFGSSIKLDPEAPTKIIPLTATKAKLVKLRVLKSKGNLASGRELFFYHTAN